MNLLKIGTHSAIRTCLNKSSASPLNIVRNLCDSPAKTSQTFEDFISSRRKQATRSIVVQVNSEKSFPELFNYCSGFGNIASAHHYRIPQDDLNYILIEFDNEETAKIAIESSHYNEEISGIPVQSSFLWFKAGSKKLQKIAANSNAPPLCTIDANNEFSNSELFRTLQTSDNIDLQMETTYSATKLNDLGVRLRFLAAKQIESSISGMFPRANAQPFGSSVNGFGRMGCDLDLILRFDEEAKPDKTDSRLVFHIKENLTNGRSQTQRQMEAIGDIMQLFLPGVCQVRRILQARVPIIKYHHEHLNLEVDLSMSNLTGLYMAEMLYIFGELDARVRPLTFCIRKWAQATGLTNPSPGRWISNFSLTCLVIFFLQQLKTPILPPLSTLMKAANANDLRITEDGINCTFVRDHNQINFRCTNNGSLSELMLQFFEYYSQFDFGHRAISLIEGKPVTKPEHSALYIVNPLEQLLNVSKNVSFEELERLRIEVRNAAWILESEMETNTLSQAEKLESPWGLLSLFKVNEKPIIRPNMFFKPRMVDVSDLFDANGNGTQQRDKINFKNQNVKSQVNSIKSQGRSDLKQMRMNAIPGENGIKGRRR